MQLEFNFDEKKEKDFVDYCFWFTGRYCTSPHGRRRVYERDGLTYIKYKGHFVQYNA